MIIVMDTALVAVTAVTAAAAILMARTAGAHHPSSVGHADHLDQEMGCGTGHRVGHP